MRRLFRFRKKKKSEPGNPPFVHRSGSEFGLKTVYFHVDPIREDVVIGPVDNGSRQGLPGFLNDGGVKTVYRKQKDGSIRAIRLRIAARPFRDIAFNLYIDKYPEEYRNAVN